VQVVPFKHKRLPLCEVFLTWLRFRSSAEAYVVPSHYALYLQLRVVSTVMRFSLEFAPIDRLGPQPLAPLGTRAASRQLLLLLCLLFLLVDVKILLRFGIRHLGVKNRMQYRNAHLLQRPQHCLILFIAGFPRWLALPRLWRCSLGLHTWFRLNW